MKNFPLLGVSEDREKISASTLGYFKNNSSILTENLLKES
jgi:hypothetical protein